jgi:uncharacterized membrane protein YfcA
LPVALLLAALAGVCLGALGGGGSSLTTPILLYVLGMPAREAIATSMLVVGATSAVGAAQHARDGNVDARTGLTFGLAGMVSALGAGRLAEYLPERVLLALFALLMLATGAAMLRRAPPLAPGAAASPALAALVGLGTGALTGLVGAGGGFIAVPALVLLLALPMKRAVGTSLLVITLNAFTGFLGHATHVQVDYAVAAALAAASISGTFVGAPLARRIPAERLRGAFAVFVLLVGAWVLTHQL